MLLIITLCDIPFDYQCLLSGRGPRRREVFDTVNTTRERSCTPSITSFVVRVPVTRVVIGSNPDPGRGELDGATFNLDAVLPFVEYPEQVTEVDRLNTKVLEDNMLLSLVSVKPGGASLCQQHEGEVVGVTQCEPVNRVTRFHRCDMTLPGSSDPMQDADRRFDCLG